MSPELVRRPPSIAKLLRACVERGQAAFVAEATQASGIHFGALRETGLWAAGRFFAVQSMRGEEDEEHPALEELRGVGAVCLCVTRYGGGIVTVRGSVAEMPLKQDETILDCYHRMTAPTEGERVRTAQLGSVSLAYQDGQLEIGTERGPGALRGKVSLPKEAELKELGFAFLGEIGRRINR